MRCGEIWAENVAPAPNTKGRNHWRQGKQGKNGKGDKCGEKLTTKVTVDVHDRTSCGKGQTYLIFVIFFTQAKFLENKIYTEKTRKLRQNTQ